MEDDAFPYWLPSESEAFTLTIVNSVSLDGYIASNPKQSDEQRQKLNMTNATDQLLVREQIKNCDAIITGAESMRAAKKAWEQTGRKGAYPLWIVMTRSGLDFDLEFFKQPHIPRALVFPSLPELSIQAKLENLGVQAWSYGRTSPADFVKQRLKEGKFCRVLLFGGGQINRLFLEARLVDYLIYTVAPVILGSKSGSHFCQTPLTSPQEGRLLSSHACGDHVFLRYSIKK